MSDIDPPVSALEQLEADKFYAALGRAIGRWSTLEYVLGLMFARITNMEEAVARKVFHSARGWRGRYDMMTEALSVSIAKPGVVTSWRSIIDKANSYSAYRNNLAHHQVRLAGRDKKSGARLLVLERPSSDISESALEETLHRNHIEAMAENFALLSCAAYHALAHDPDDQLGSPERLQRLVSLLPSRAQIRTSDPNLAAEFLLGQQVQPFPH